jgi:ribosomal protein S12 methylthiotransferase
MMGVFSYSQEQETSSYSLGDPVPEKIKNQRAGVLMEIQKEISHKKNRELIGTRMTTIIDKKNGGGIYEGRAMRHAPEVDGAVIIETEKEIFPGGFYDASIYDCNEYDLFARI